jgi:hypothetical protein
MAKMSVLEIVGLCSLLATITVIYIGIGRNHLRLSLFSLWALIIAILFIVVPMYVQKPTSVNTNTQSSVSYQ